MDSAEFDALWSGLDASPVSSGVAPSIAPIAPPQSTSPGFLKEAANSVMLAGQGITGGYLAELGANITSPIMGTSYQDEVKALESILGTARQETPVAGTVAEIGGSIASPLSKILPGGGLKKKLLAGALQGGIAGFGEGGTLEERASNATTGAGVGSAVTGLFGVAGKGIKAAGNWLKGSEQSAKNAAYGLRYTDVLKSIQHTPHLIADEIPIEDSLNRIAKTGALSLDDAASNQRLIQGVQKETGQGLFKLVKEADRLMPASKTELETIIPGKEIATGLFDTSGKEITRKTADTIKKEVVTEKLVKSFPRVSEYLKSTAVDPDAQEQAVKTAERIIANTQKSNNSLAELQKAATSFNNAASRTLGKEGEDQIQANIKKWVARDINDQIEARLREVDPALAQKYAGLKQAQGDAYNLERVFDKTAARDAASSPKDKITNFFRTTRGASGAAIGATAIGGPIAGALTYAGALALAPKSSELALGRGLEKAGALARPVGQYLFNSDTQAGRVATQLFVNGAGDKRPPETLGQSSAMPSSQLTTDDFDALWNSLDEKKNDVAPATGEGVKPVALLQQGLDEAGITDPQERAQFLGQMAHESANFNRLEEMGSKKYLSMYEPGTRKGKMLGNTEKGDSVRFKGRGFIQLSGRANYKKYGDLVGEDLIANPERAADPEVAKKIAIAYWNDRVKPKVTDFSDTTQVTKLINGGYNGLADRKKKVELFSTKVETV